MQRAREGFRCEGTLTAGLPPTSLRSCKRQERGISRGRGQHTKGTGVLQNAPSRALSKSISVG